MTIITPKTIFFHIPKTGGTWVTDAMRKATYVMAEIPGHPRATALRYYGLFAFSFVRHPINWYRSYFAYRMRCGWRPHDFGMDVYGTEDFNEWIIKCTEIDWGYLSNTMDLRLGHRMNFVGKTETLVDDLIKALTLAGEKFDEGLIRDTPVVNVSPDIDKYQYKPEVAKKLIESEMPMIRRFKFTTDYKEALNEGICRV